MERLVLRMATSEGLGAKTRIQYTETSMGFVAYIEAFSDLLFGTHHVSFPIIPDEFNPEGKSINPGMEPHPFTSLADCRKAAEEAEMVMLKSLRKEEFASKYKSKTVPCKKPGTKQKK